MCGDKDCPVMDLSKVVPESKYSFQDVKSLDADNMRIGNMAFCKSINK